MPFTHEKCDNKKARSAFRAKARFSIPASVNFCHSFLTPLPLPHRSTILRLLLDCSYHSSSIPLPPRSTILRLLDSRLHFSSPAQEHDFATPFIIPLPIPRRSTILQLLLSFLFLFCAGARFCDSFYHSSSSFFSPSPKELSSSAFCTLNTFAM